MNTKSGPAPRLGGFDQTKTATLRYMETTLSLDPAIAGVASSYVFSGNGLYDPNITGVGHQPLGFDEWMGIYSHYTVTGFTMKATFFNTDANQPQFCGIKVTAAGAAITDGRTTIEQGNCRYAILGPRDKSGSESQKSITLTVDNSKFFGKDVLSDRDYMGTNATNPLEQLYPTVFAFPNAVVDGDIVDCQVIIDFRVQFSEPRLVASS